MVLGGTTLPGTNQPLEFVDIARGSAKFDLELYLEEWPTGLYGYVEYASDLFDRSRIERLVMHYRTLLEAIVADPSQAIGKLALLTEQERRQVIEQWNATDRAYPAGQCMHSLFEEQ